MSTPLALLLARVGVIVLLWVFVLAVVRVVASDLWYDRASRVHPGRDVRRQARDARRNAPRKVVITTGPATGTSATLGDQPVTVGRSDGNTLVLADDYASNQHARLIPDGTVGWMVEDLGSTNGTYLGAERVVEPVPVELGEQIRIGKSVLELRR